MKEKFWGAIGAAWIYSMCLIGTAEMFCMAVERVSDLTSGRARSLYQIGKDAVESIKEERRTNES